MKNVIENIEANVLVAIVKREKNMKPEEVSTLKEEISTLKEEVEKQKDIVRSQYKFQWFFRNKMLPIHGKICKQSKDAKGIIMPDGKFITYGEEYFKLYFLGEIM